MKLILHILFFFTISTNLLSQSKESQVRAIYLDSTWAETTEENHKYIRVVEDYFSNKNIYVFKDYFKSKKLCMIGGSSDKDILKREGQFIYYYENGNKKAVVNYSKNNKTGIEYRWYENGNIKAELDHSKIKDADVDFKINNYWNPQQEQKVISGNGSVDYSDENQEDIGEVKDGLPDGIWKGKNLKRKFSYIENYRKGKFISGISTDSQGIEHQYKHLEIRPEPKKGIKDFYQYIGKNYKKTENAIANKISGKLVLSFIIDKDGSITEPKILKSLGYGLDEEAIRVITNYNGWIPGQQKGINVRALYSIPITVSN